MQPANNQHDKLITKLIAIIIIAATISSTFAFPFGPDIPIPTNQTGSARGCFEENARYQAGFTSTFGGNWNLRGVHHADPGGAGFSDTINGTISDTTINGTFDNYTSGFSWYMESMHACGSGWTPATAFLLIIDNGSVHGYAVYY